MTSLSRRGFLIGAGAVAAAAALPVAAKAVPAGWVAIEPPAADMTAYWMGRGGLYIIVSPDQVVNLFGYDRELGLWSKLYVADLHAYTNRWGDIPVLKTENIPGWPSRLSKARTSPRSTTTPTRNTSTFTSKPARRGATTTFRPRSMRA